MRFFANGRSIANMHFCEMAVCFMFCISKGFYVLCECDSGFEMRAVWNLTLASAGA
jgi:hypothetical protein